MYSNHSPQPLHQPLDLAHMLEAFRAAYTAEEAQDHLWRLLHPVLLAHAPMLDTEEGRETVAFCERLELLVAAVYGVPVSSKTADAAAGPLAAALDTLHQEVKQSWVLLISPPD